MRQQNIDNAYARYCYLLAALDNDDDQLSDDFIAALKNQRKFAQLAVKDHFEAMTLNTLKAAASLALMKEARPDDGWELLDSLRLKLARRVKSKKTGRSHAAIEKRSKDKVALLQLRLRETALTNALQSQAYRDLFCKIRFLLENALLEDRTQQRLHNLLEDHRALYGHLMSFDLQSNTVEIHVVKGGTDR